MKMTANRRIWLNIAATYARNAYSLVLGLVTEAVMLPFAWFVVNFSQCLAVVDI